MHMIRNFFFKCCFIQSCIKCRIQSLPSNNHIPNTIEEYAYARAYKQKYKEEVRGKLSPATA